MFGREQALSGRPIMPEPVRESHKIDLTSLRSRHTDAIDASVNDVRERGGGGLEKKRRRLECVWLSTASNKLHAAIESRRRHVLLYVYIIVMHRV